jgi:hypothetical protein
VKDLRDCHVYSQQAFAAPEQLGAVGALFQRRCILADAIDTSGDAADDAAGIGNAGAADNAGAID